MTSRRFNKKAFISQVFINIPYGEDYEKLLLAYTCVIVALRRIPRLAFEATEGGKSRLDKIMDLLETCQLSIHDLSAVEGHPTEEPGPDGKPRKLIRFNMPFELGLACHIKRQYAGRRNYEYFVFEAVKYRIHKTLSDLLGVDTKAHEMNPIMLISEALDAFHGASNLPINGLNAANVTKLYMMLEAEAERLKIANNKKSLFKVSIYVPLVAYAIEQANILLE